MSVYEVTLKLGDEISLSMEQPTIEEAIAEAINFVRDEYITDEHHIESIKCEETP